MLEQGLKLYLARLGIRGTKKYLETLTLILDRCTDINKDRFDQYLFELQKSGRRNATLNKYISVIKTYGRFKKWEWVESLERWKEQEVFIAIMSDEEIEDFLSLPLPPETPIKRWKMWTMFFTIQAYTGMRNNEIASLTVDNVDFGTNNFNLLETKTRPRQVPIPNILKAPLKEYVQTVEHYLFPSDRTKKYVSSSAWHQQFCRRIKILGIKRANLHPYSVRHSWVTTMLSNGVGMAQVQRIAGHKDISTTQKYTHLINKDLQQVINDHPNLKKYESPIDLLKYFVEEAKKRGLLNRQDINYEISNTRFSIEVNQIH